MRTFPRLSPKHSLRIMRHKKTQEAQIESEKPLCFLCLFLACETILLTYPCSESLPKANLKTEIVGASAQPSGGSLLILRDERKSIGHAILELEDLIRIRSDVS